MPKNPVIRFRNLRFLILLPCLAFAGRAAAQMPGAGAPDMVPRETRPVGAAALEFPALEGAVNPAEYTLGPGDEMELALLGRVSARVPVTVDAEGSIYVPNVGHVRVAGLTLAEAREKLADRFARAYRGVRADLTLARPRRVRVHVTGEVGRPGLVELQGPVRVSQAILAAGDTTSLSSLRNIHVERDGGPALSADLLTYRVTGDKLVNPFLRDGDVVVVPARVQTVEVQGEVARPRVLEFRDGDALAQVLALAGGLRASADSDTVELWRFVTPNRSENSSLPLRAALKQPGGPADPRMAAGDRIYVRRSGEWHRQASVRVQGEVMQPGIYAISPDGEPASRLVARFGGFTSYADTRNAAIARTGSRPARDSAYVALLQSGLRELSHEDQEYLKMHALAEANLSARLRGALASPGTPGADLILLDGDVITVPSRSRSVGVYGAVRRPGLVAYEEGSELERYVKAAGGWGDRADRGHVRVTRAATAQPVPARDVSTVGEGDIIWIPERPPRSFVHAATTVITLVAQLATIALVIHEANK